MCFHTWSSSFTFFPLFAHTMHRSLQLTQNPSLLHYWLDSEFQHRQILTTSTEYDLANVKHECPQQCLCVTLTESILSPTRKLVLEAAPPGTIWKQTKTIKQKLRQYIYFTNTLDQLVPALFRKKNLTHFICPRQAPGTKRVCITTLLQLNTFGTWARKLQTKKRAIVLW